METVFTTLDYKELLKRKDIDAIIVTSLDFTHEEYAIAALNAGKHVYLEKPMAITTKGCDNILKAWKHSGKKLMIGFNMRHMRIFQTMKDIADTGTIGEIKAVWVRHFVGYGGLWYFHDWHARRNNTTGLLLQKAAHDIDMIHWITDSYAKKVAAFGGLDFYGGNKSNDLKCSECPEKDTCTDVQSQNEKRSKMQQCVFRKEPVSTPEAGRMSVATGYAATESLRNGGKVIKIPSMPGLT